MRRNLVCSLLLAVGYLAFTWPQSPVVVETPMSTFHAGLKGRGPTQADRKATEYWRKHPQARSRPAAITVADLTTSFSDVPGTTLAATVPAGGVPQGTRVVICFVCVATTGTLSCTDDRGNPYAVDVDVTNPSGQRLTLLSAPVLTSLQPGDAITLRHPKRGNRAMALVIVDGLANGGERDQFNSAFGSGPSPTSGPTSPTIAGAALVGGVTSENASLSNFTAGAGWRVGRTAGTATGVDDCIVNPVFRVVDARGNWAANGKFAEGRPWSAGIVSYRAAGGSR